MDTIEKCSIAIRREKVLIDCDVAEIYGVETKRVTEAVKNNLDKFPEDYLFELSQDEKNELVENFDRLNRLKHSTENSKIFTWKGFYMLAAILISKQATETTFAIIETLHESANYLEPSSNLQKPKPTTSPYAEERSNYSRSFGWGFFHYGYRNDTETM